MLWRYYPFVRFTATDASHDISSSHFLFLHPSIHPSSHPSNHPCDTTTLDATAFEATAIIIYEEWGSESGGAPPVDAK